MALSLAALVLAAFFAAAALYITLVEHPARLSLDDAAMLAQWQPSYARALPIQAGLALLGSVVGLLGWYYAYQWQMLSGAILLLANWPYTFLAIRPTNKRLQAIQPSTAGSEARRLLRRWGALHAVRSLLGCVAVAFFVWAILTPPAAPPHSILRDSVMSIPPPGAAPGTTPR